VSYNSAHHLTACLAAIDRAAPGMRVAIREHGNDVAASLQLDELAAGYPGTIRVERDPSNPGFASGCNALARTSTADFLMFLNPDAELVEWPWSQRMPPTKVIVGPMMVDSGDPARHWGREYRVRDEIARSWLRHRGRRPDGRGFVSGAALLVDRASFERVGGFDDRYFMFYEDIDFCLRANRVDIATIVDERWRVRHAGAHSTQAAFGASLLWSYRSAVRFHGGRGASMAGYLAYVVADAAMRAALSVARSDRKRAEAYVHLAHRASRDLFDLVALGPGRTPRSSPLPDP
jgi:N-acetylglucosaminyl-diphospho-decaprenol L-rhamnosyltransferase